MANTPRTSNTSRKNPPIRVKDSPAMTEQVVLITLSPGMNCVAQSTQYAISSGGQNVASSETKAASMKALPKRNHRLRSLYLRLLRHRLTVKRLAKSAHQHTFQMVMVYSSGTPLRNSRQMARASARCPIRMRQASTRTFRPTPNRKRKTKYFSFSMAAGPLCGDIRSCGRLEPAGDSAFDLLIQAGHIGLKVLDGFVDGVAAEEEDAYDGEKRNDDCGDRSHTGFLSIEQNLDDAHDLSDNGDQEKQQSQIRSEE